MGLTLEQQKAVALATARAKAKAKSTVAAAKEGEGEGLDLLKMAGDVVGAVGDAANAFQSGANQGMTLGFGDEISAGMLAPLTEIGAAFEGKGYDLGRGYQHNLAAIQAREQKKRDKNEVSAIVGDVTGAAIPLAAVGATKLGGELLGMTGGLPSRILAGGTSGGVITAVDTLGRGGSMDDVINNARMGAFIGGGLPVLGALGKHAIAAATGKALDPAETALARATAADGIDPADIPARLQALGHDAVWADLGPNLQRQAGALASLPGEAQSKVRQALMNRAEGTNARIISDVDDTLGPAPIPSREAANIRANQDALGPEYEQTLLNKALSPDFEFDPAIVGNALETTIPQTVGQTQSRLEAVRRMLIDPDTGQYTTNPSIVLEVRKELDAMIGLETNTNAQRAMEHVRRVLDEDLGAQVAGLKNVDAKFAELARQNEALGTGQQLLDSGRTAVRPAELDTMMQQGALPQGAQVGPSAVPFRLTQGARAEIERIIGTTANDLNALKTALKGDGSWNRDRLVTLFGQDRADRLLQILDREKTFAQTNHVVTQNSETAARQAAQSEFDAGTVKATRDITVPGLVFMGAQKLANLGARTRRSATNAAVADALMSRSGQVDPAMITAVQRALAQRQQRALFSPVAGSLAFTGQGG